MRHLCTGEARVRVMEARAGTGKTFTLAAVREAYEHSGVPVIGVAWQGQAADVLQREAGHPVSDRRPPPAPDRAGRGRRHPRPLGDRGGRGLGDADARPRAPRSRRGLALGAPCACRRPRTAPLDRRRRRLRRARRPPRCGGADREPPPADRAAARCRTPSGRGARRRRGRAALRARAPPVLRGRARRAHGACQRVGRGRARLTRAQPDARPRPPRRRRAEPDRAASGASGGASSPTGGSPPRAPSGRSAIAWCAAATTTPSACATAPTGRWSTSAATPSTWISAPTTARRSASRPTTSPTPATATPSPGTSPRGVGRSHLRPREPRARRGRVGVRRRHHASATTFRSSSSTTRPRTSRRPSPAPGRARRPSRSPSTWLIRRSGASAMDAVRARSRRRDARAADGPGRGAARGARVARGRGGAVPNHELARVAELRAALERAEPGREGGRDPRGAPRRASQRIPAWRRGERARGARRPRAGATGRRAPRDEGRAAQAGWRALGPAADGHAPSSVPAHRLRSCPRSAPLDAWSGSRGASPFGRSRPSP